MDKKIVKEINYFKGLSIIGVVLYHIISMYMTSVHSIIKYAANAGSAGVLVFFFCSGFGLYLSMDKNTNIDKKDIFSFIKKRIIKIYVPYIFIILILLCIPLVYGGKNRVIGALSHIFLFRCFNEEYFEAYGGHFWYIGTLFQLYLIFIPLYILLKKVRENWFIIISALISISYLFVLYLLKLENSQIAIRLFFKYIIEFSFGMFIASLYKKDRLKINNKILIGLALIGISIYAVSGKSSIGRLLNDIPEFIGVLSLFYLLYKINFLGANNIITSINKISFEIYLIHMPILEIVFKMSNGTIQNDLVCAVISISVTVFIAIIYNKFNKKVLNKIM